MAEHGPHVPLAEEDVDAEASDARDRVGEVHLLALHQRVVADLAQQRHGRLAHEVARHRRQVILRLEVAVHPHDGTRTGLEMQIGGVALHALGQELVEVHGRSYLAAFWGSAGIGAGPPPTGLRPSAARTLTSRSERTLGLSLRYFLAFSRPWPIRSVPYVCQVPDFSTRFCSTAASSTEPSLEMPSP